MTVLPARNNTTTRRHASHSPCCVHVCVQVNPITTMASASSSSTASPSPSSSSASGPALPHGIPESRLRWLNDKPKPLLVHHHQQDASCVVYWMQRSVRSELNHALDMAITWANHLDLPLLVLYCFVPTYPGANERGFAFLIDGMSEVQASLKRRGIQMIVR